MPRRRSSWFPLSGSQNSNAELVAGQWYDICTFVSICQTWIRNVHCGFEFNRILRHTVDARIYQFQKCSNSGVRYKVNTNDLQEVRTYIGYSSWASRKVLDAALALPPEDRAAAHADLAFLIESSIAG